MFQNYAKRRLKKVLKTRYEITYIYLRIPLLKIPMPFFFRVGHVFADNYEEAKAKIKQLDPKFVCVWDIKIEEVFIKGER